MKTLKIFILLTGLFALIQTNSKAQLVGAATYSQPIDVEVYMALPMSGNFGVAYSTDAMGRAETTVTLTSNILTELAIRIYDGNTVLEEYRSGNVTLSHTFDITFDYGYRPNALLFIECGYISNGNYIPDSGCIVVVEPR